MPANTRELRRRIRATQSIGKITKAMEMIAASKMRKAQQAAVRSKAYAATAWGMLQALGAAIPHDQTLHPLLKAGDRGPFGATQGKPRTTTSCIRGKQGTGDSGAPLLVVITPNRGLCGALPTQVIQQAERGLTPHVGSDPPNAKAQFLAIGRKGERALLRRNKKLAASFSGFETTPTAAEIRPIARTIIDLFLTDEINEVRLVYAEFISTVRYEPKALPLLPITQSPNLPRTDAKRLVRGHPITQSPEYLFEPNPTEVLSSLLPRLVELEIYQAILEGLASEHSARMVAMRNASDAASDLLDDFTLTYNSLRQQAITTELADIVGGLKALTS